MSLNVRERQLRKRIHYYFVTAIEIVHSKSVAAILPDKASFYVRGRTFNHRASSLAPQYDRIRKRCRE